MTAGAPRQYTAEGIIKLLNEYIENEDNPTVEGFLLDTDDAPNSKDTLYRYEKESEELSNAIKKLHMKQQRRTVNLAEKGEIPTAWAIFKMKQQCYGWTDKQVVEATNTNKNLNLEVDSIEEADRIIAEAKAKGEM